MTVLLKRPPSATFHDVNVHEFSEDHSGVATSDPTDTDYIQASWKLANLVQEKICGLRALDMPIYSTKRQRAQLISDFRAVHRTFPDTFRSWDATTIGSLAITNKRLVRQTLFLSSNYWHNLMLVHASETADLPMVVRSTLDAAHEAIHAFFTLWRLLAREARIWWVFNHRAFLEALCIGNILHKKSSQGESEDEAFKKEPIYMRAKKDLSKLPIRKRPEGVETIFVLVPAVFSNSFSPCFSVSLPCQKEINTRETRELLS